MPDVEVVITPTPDVVVEVTEEGSPPVSVTLTPPPEVVEVQVPGPAGPQGEQGPPGEPGEGGGASTWDELTGKPSTFPPSTHATSHKGDGSDPIANATTSVAGLESAADKTKLDGIETAATADQTAAEILTAIKTVDGTGSGLDADLLDGNNSSAFAAALHEHDHITNLETDSRLHDDPLTDYPTGFSSMPSADYETAGTFASEWNPGVVETTRYSDEVDELEKGFQAHKSPPGNIGTMIAYRSWNDAGEVWGAWETVNKWDDLTGKPSTFAPSSHATSHVTGGSDVIANAVAGGNAGLLSGTDKTKLDGIEAGATGDQTAAEIRGAMKLPEDAFDGSAGISSFDVGVSYLPISTSSTGWPIAATTFHVLILKQDGSSAKQAAVQRTAARHWERHWSGSAWSSWVETTDVANLTGYSALATDAEVTSAISAHEALSDPHPGYLTPAEANALYKAIGYVPDWADITGKPSTFAPSAHAATHTNGTDDIQSATASQKGLMTSAYASKLDGIEAAATADQTAAEILTAIKTVDGTGSGLDADLLDGHDTGYFATAAHAAQHKGDGSDPIANATTSVAGLESAADKTKLDGIETGATADQTAAEILTAIKTVDGTGSGLDADLLDGNNSSAFVLGTDYEDADVLAKVKNVDGAGSGLDADLLDGHDTSYFATATGLSDHLADTSDAHDASAISVLDTGANFAGSDVEAVLAEIADSATATGLLNTVEVNLGTVPRRGGHFDITTSGLTVGQNVIVEQINGPYTGKGTQADEAEMDQITVSGQAISNTVIRCYWTSTTHVRGNFKFAYTLVSTLNTVPEATTTTSGLVKSAFQQTHIEGLRLVWNTPGTNGTNLTVTSGSAWVPSVGAVVDVPSTLTGPSMTFSASTWYYVYLTSSGTLEISTTAPAAAYKGTARTKTGDTSRRLLGAVLTDAAGSPAMIQFLHLGDEMIYNAASPGGIYRVINGAGPGVTNTTQSLAAICPPGITTDVAGSLTASTGATAGVAIIEYMLLSSQRWGIAGGIMGASGFLFTSSWFPVNPATPSFIYSTTGPASSAFYFDVGGYKFVR